MKIKGQISLWKCDIKTTNIYAAHMETFNQSNITLIFTVSWRENDFLSLHSSKNSLRDSKVQFLLGNNRVKYLYFTDTAPNVPDSKQDTNKFLHILLYLKGIHVNIHAFFFEKHYRII